MLQRLQTQKVSGLLVAIAIAVTALPSQAQLFNSPVDKLPSTERVALQSGKPLVTGEKGQYVARVLITTSPQAVWSVLTDYDNFSRFIPNVTSSKVLQADGNHKVVEQTDVRSVLFFTVRSRIRSKITETVNQRIEFHRIEGDLPLLDGYWQIESVAPYNGAPAKQVLITQVVSVKPSSSFGESTFYNIFKGALGDNLAAISREVGRRQQ